jgi:hypothetical protein
MPTFQRTKPNSIMGEESFTITTQQSNLLQNVDKYVYLIQLILHLTLAAMHISSQAHN